MDTTVHLTPQDILFASSASKSDGQSMVIREQGKSEIKNNLEV